MQYKSTKNALTAGNKLLYGSGGVTVVRYAFVFLLGALGYPPWVVACFAGGILLSALIMPIVYHAVNGSMNLSVGRYHLPLTICGILLPASSAALFALGGLSDGGAAAIGAALCFVAGLSSQTYEYAYRSIARRIDEDGCLRRYARFFGAAGLLAFSTAAMFLFRGSAAGAGNVMMLCAAVQTVGALFAYVGTVTRMPQYIRLQPTTVRSLRGKYRAYLSPLAHFSARTAVIGGAMAAAGVFAFVLTAAARARSFGLPHGTLYFGAIPAFAAGAAIAYLAVSRCKRSAMSAVGAVIMVAALALPVLPVFCALGQHTRFALHYASAALGGASSALMTAGSNGAARAVCADTGISRGMFGSLRMCASVVAASLSMGAAVLATQLSNVSGVAALLFMSGLIAAVSVTGGALVCFTRTKKTAVKGSEKNA